MKRYAGMLLTLCMVFLWGCGRSADAAPSTSEAEVTETTSWREEETPSFRDYTKRFEIIDVREHSLLVCGLNDRYSLYKAGHGPIREDVDGAVMEIADLKPGMIVELTWPGDVLESYPGQFCYEKLRVTEEKGSKELEFYKRLLQDLAEVDPGLNEGMEQSFFDLSHVASLSENEKEGLAYIGGSYFGAMGITATQEELAELGVLDPVKGIEKGILITIEETSNKDNKLNCNARKYRSGTGAYYFQNVEAVFEDGEWSYTIGSHTIS